MEFLSLGVDNFTYFNHFVKESSKGKTKRKIFDNHVITSSVPDSSHNIVFVALHS